MADYVVAGIARTSDPAELEKLLMGCAHLDPARLAVVTKAIATSKHDDSPLRFLHSRGPNVNTGSDGTGVPGIGRGAASLSSFVGHASVPNYLRDVAIPHDVAENYNIAISEGRSVVTYRATDDAEAVAQTFRECGLVNVKIIAPRPLKQGAGTQ